MSAVAHVPLTPEAAASSSVAPATRIGVGMKTPHATAIRGDVVHKDRLAEISPSGLASTDLAIREFRDF